MNVRPHHAGRDPSSNRAKTSTKVRHGIRYHYTSLGGLVRRETKETPTNAFSVKLLVPALRHKLEEQGFIAEPIIHAFT